MFAALVSKTDTHPVDVQKVEPSWPVLSFFCDAVIMLLLSLHDEPDAIALGRYMQAGRNLYDACDVAHVDPADIYRNTTWYTVPSGPSQSCSYHLLSVCALSPSLRPFSPRRIMYNYMSVSSVCLFPLNFSAREIDHGQVAFTPEQARLLYCLATAGRRKSVM